MVFYHACSETHVFNMDDSMDGVSHDSMDGVSHDSMDGVSHISPRVSTVRKRELQNF